MDNDRIAIITIGIVIWVGICGITAYQIAELFVCK